MLYVGLDVHSRQSSLCILNSGGGTVNQFQVKGPRSALAAHVAVAHPGKLRLISSSRQKNDRVDAQKLAKLLLLDMVPQVHVPHVDVRGWRSLILLRQKLIGQLVRAKNQIRGVLRENDITGPKWLWSKRQIAWLESLELHSSAKLRLELGICELKNVNEKIARVEKEF